MNEDLEIRVRGAEEQLVSYSHRIKALEKRQEEGDKRRNQVLGGAILLVLGSFLAWGVDIIKGALK